MIKVSFLFAVLMASLASMAQQTTFVDPDGRSRVTYDDGTTWEILPEVKTKVTFIDGSGESKISWDRGKTWTKEWSATEAEKSTLDVFPNPATERLVVVLPTTAAVQSLHITSLDGREVSGQVQFTVVNDQLQIQTGDLPQGLYVVSIATETPEVLVTQFSILR